MKNQFSNSDRLTTSQVAAERRVPVKIILEWCESGYLTYHVDENGEYYFIKSEVK